MYFFLNSGHTSTVKCAQWLQVMEAYSTTVTLASGGPSAISPRGPGFISSSTGTSVGPLLCAVSGRKESPIPAQTTERPSASDSARRDTGAQREEVSERVTKGLLVVARRRHH